ncbi:MAG: ankyrin repeat domain-containing protein [Myxococcales bacterium]|nr:ankyrin repeat domain-containing protein [Myxococcales bacterium]USN50841.1 MAG: ankyrin repeat domain-containing protein [Myxococcales bacterium]
MKLGENLFSFFSFLSPFFISIPLECSHLFESIENYDVQAIEAALSKGVDVNCINKDGYTPLQMAAKKGSLEIVRLLLNHNANIDAKSKYGSALYLASANKYLEICSLLLESGAKVISLHAASGKGFIEIVNLLIDFGALINERNSYGATPLHEASYYGKTAMVEILIARGAQLDIRDDSNATPLIGASMQGHANTVRSFIKEARKVDNSWLYPEMNWALYEASGEGHLPVVDELLGSGADINSMYQGDGATPLYFAMRKQQNKIVARLLFSGSNITAEEEKYSPLGYAQYLKKQDNSKEARELYTLIDKFAEDAMPLIIMKNKFADGKKN